MDALGDCAETAWSMVNGVHRRDHCEKNLRRANVAGRFVAPDMLLAGLQREPIGRPAFSVVGNTNESARHVTFVLIARRKVSRVRSAESDRNTETLSTAYRHVGAEFTRRF